eukprot:GGOE01054533.1.p1 GENE.GGOE01054533.1~~GGOE01054533.1.p1  ORF type:complete len:315 (-),score=85.39 GGOE01054533.1:270-1166(-)
MPELQIVRTIAEYRVVRSKLGGTVGLVPTMGCLHEAHMSLVNLCAGKCDHTVITIFVNPAQFAPNEDFDAYPRQLQDDIELIRKQEIPSVVVFCPERSEMYPDPCPPHPLLPQTSYPPAYVDVERFVEGKAEALSRKGFFTGVATVCVKLFNIASPHFVVLGKKDRLQCYVLQQVVHDLCMPIELVFGETHREPHGLAMSSRNRYLSATERERAVVIYASLLEGKKLCASGTRCVHAIRSAVIEKLQAEPGLEVLYVVVSALKDMTDFAPEDDVPPEGAVLSCAVKYGPARLIDNIDI